MASKSARPNPATRRRSGRSTSPPFRVRTRPIWSSGWSRTATSCCRWSRSSRIGSRLIRDSLERLGNQGEELVFLVGEPAYYRRFGFAAETAAQFASPYAGPYFMALALGDIDIPAAGRADYAPAFAGLE